MKANKYLIYFFFFTLATIVTNLNAYMGSKTANNYQIKWRSADSHVDVYFNASNPYGVDENVLNGIIANSAAEWAFLSTVSITNGSTSGKNQELVNEIYFTNDTNVFNSTNIAVAAITEVSYRESDGTIIEADVLINENNLISTNITTYNYIGNIATHELGHLLGLDHSQVIGSTMFWTLSHGQNKVGDDDKAGLYAIYPTGSSNIKSISGKIIGGSNRYGVFGVDVEAISQLTGKIMGESISDTNGNFTIDGLPVGDKYFIYTKPSAYIRLSSAYASVKANFCDTGSSYRGSFYQACGGGNEGYPQAFSLSSGNVNVGNITIRCSLDVPPEYMQKKSDGLTDFSVIQNTQNGIGNAFVGFFSNQEMQNGISKDQFNINLTNITPTEWAALSSSVLYLNVRVNNQNFYTAMKAVVTIKQGSSTFTIPKYIRESDGWINIESDMYVAIDKTTAANNLFNITITPELMTSLITPSGLPASMAYILPDYSDFLDSTYFYLFNAQIVKSNGDGTYSKVSSKNYITSDNYSCTDANNTYQLSSYTTSGKISASKEQEKTIACGTITTKSDNNGNGPFGMIVGVSLAFVIISLSRRMRFI